MPCVKKTSSKAKLQQPKWISHFGQPVVQLENDSKGSEYSDSDEIILDSYQVLQDDKKPLLSAAALS